MSGKPHPSGFPVRKAETQRAEENKKENGISQPQRTQAGYSNPAVRMPSHHQLEKLARECGLELNQDELQAYRQVIRKTVDRLNEASRLPELTLPVKYPRTPGHRPAPEENPFNAWSYVCEIPGARHGSGKLRGKRIGIKDSIAVAGVPLLNGCHSLEGYVPDFDATVVTKILDEGGIICGKTTCEDMCYSGSSFTGANGPVLNPHNTTMSAGGSSSGSAVAIATGDADMALGTDQGGSIRTPAAWCGVVGMKPTYGLVPFTGAISMEPTIDHIGPMAANVDDCALLLEVIAGYDKGLDHRQFPGMTIPQYSKAIQNCEIEGQRVGILVEGFSKEVGDPRLYDMVYDSIMGLRHHGADVRDVSVPMHKVGSIAFTCFAKEGINEAMLQNGGGGYGNHGYYPSSMMAQVSKALKARPNDMSHRIKLTRLLGEYMKKNYHGRFYAKGRNLVLMLRQAYDAALQDVDILALPTVPYTATKLPLHDCSVEEHFNMSSTSSMNTSPFNCTGHPAINVPIGKLDGLPVGLSLVGRHFDEVNLFRVAKVIEKIRQENAKHGTKELTARL